MVRRRKIGETHWGPWQRLGNRLSYGTMGAANNLIGRDKSRQAEHDSRWPKREDSDYCVQRRPVDQWEVVK